MGRRNFLAAKQNIQGMADHLGINLDGVDPIGQLQRTKDILHQLSVSTWELTPNNAPDCKP